MALLVGPRRAVPATMMIVAALGCEVHGLIGSNATAGDEADPSGGETSITTADDEGTTLGTADSADGGGDESGGEDTLDVRFDLGTPDAPGGCDVPDQWPSCDTVGNDPFHAMGLNCPDTSGPQVDGTFNGFDGAMTVHTGKLGQSAEFGAREGEKFAVLSTGDASDLTLSPEELRLKYENHPNTTHPCKALYGGGCPSTVLMDLDGVLPDDPPLYMLPPPLDVRPVDGVCGEDPDIVGTGDCSKSLWDQWIAAGVEPGKGAARAFDYSELRMTTTVPEGIDGLSYDFAFFSIEYPLYEDHNSLFNDMYVAWLDSETWTGNISFDRNGHVISVNSVLFDYKSASSNCPNCNAPQLKGFAAEDHGGTKWLTTTAPVHPGEPITLVLALFDMGDATFDSMVILDHFEWTCSGAPPFTTPAG